MPLLVDAVYENGVLRPLQPLDLKEQERLIAKYSRIHYPVAAFTERCSRLRKEISDHLACIVQEPQDRLPVLIWKNARVGASFDHGGKQVNYTLERACP